MKIAFIGAPCSGKTTLVNELIQHNPRFTVLTEVASDIFTRFETAKREHFMTQLAILTQVFLAEQKHEATANLLCDRSLMDAYIYLKLLKAEDYISYAMVEFLKEHMRSYGKIFLCDFEGIRWENTESRTEVLDQRALIQGTFKTVLNDWRIPFYTISGSRSRRVREVLSYLNPGQAVLRNAYFESANLTSSTIRYTGTGEDTPYY